LPAVALPRHRELRPCCHRCLVQPCGIQKQICVIHLTKAPVVTRYASKPLVAYIAEHISGGLSRYACAFLMVCFAALPLRCLAAVQAAADQDGAVGSEVFAKQCSTCHGELGQGKAAAVTILGPSLQAEHDLGQVMSAVESGPSHMPAFSRVLSAEEIREVSRYVTSQIAVIPMSGGDIGEGGKLFRMYCATCHRTAVRGGAMAFTGRNAPDLANKSGALIAGAIRWGPGTMPSFPESVLNDQQLDSIVEYVKFVQHPPNPGGNPLKYFGPVSEGCVGAAGLLALIGIAGWIERGGKG